MKLRKVLFKKPTPTEWIKSESGEKIGIATSQEEIEFTNEGLFHQWANAYIGNINGGFSNYTIGIIETEDGTIEKVLPERIKFIYSPTQ